MDRYCEFCVNLRSVVYCKADAAYLCLTCDTKVHSANPLSSRHYRTLVCESCKRRPAYVRCYNHQKFMCRGCDLSQHDASSDHRKRAINSYGGSPSATDLATLWGFDLNRFADRSKILNDTFGSSSSGSTNTSLVDIETGTSGSMSEDIKAIYEGGKNEVSSVLQQLVDLLTIQISNDSHISSMNMIRHQEQKLEKDFGQFMQQSVLGGVHPHDHDSSLDRCSLSFSQLDHLAASGIDESALQGDSFWQCKSPVQSGELWSQNMQDLGVCEEPTCLDDLNIPDIDLTFRNFEELFRTEQDPTEDVSMATLVTFVESSPKKPRYAPQSMSFSHSRLSAESSGTECIDSGISPSCGSPEHHESTKSKGKKNVSQKQGQCGYKKARSDTRKRAKSQRWKFEGHESATRSC